MPPVSSSPAPDKAAAVAPARTPTPVVAHFHRAAAALSGLVVLIGASVLVGWFYALEPLQTVFPGAAPMLPNTAIGLLLAGGALGVYQLTTWPHWRHPALRFLAWGTAFVAAVTLLEYLGGWDLGIERVLLSDLPATAWVASSTALATGICLALISAAILIGDVPGRYVLAQVLVLVVAVISLVSTVGYFFDVDIQTGLPALTAMSVHTAVALQFLCMAFFLAKPDEGVMETVTEEGPGGLLIRQLMPAVVLLPLLLAWISWQGRRVGWYEPGFAMALFVTLSTAALTYVLWFGGRLLRRFEEGRLAEEHLRLQSEERLRRAVTDAPVPMVIHDDQDHILHMSRGWTDYSGYALADTPTITAWTEKAQATAKFAVKAYMEKVAGTNETLHGGESTVTAKNGSEHIWEFSTTPLGVLGTGQRSFLTMALDITERKRAEADLRQMNDSLEQRIASRTRELTNANDALTRQSAQLAEQAALLDLVRDGILVRDLHGTVIYWSVGATEMYGWSREEALGKVGHLLVQADYGRARQEIEKQVFATGFWEGEAIQTTRDGRRLSVESRWTLTRNERGVPEGFLEVNRDITAKKRAEESIRESELRFRSVAETANEGIVSADASGVIRYWNPGAERMFGHTEAAMIGQPITTMMPTRMREQHLDGIGHFLKTGESRLAGRTIEGAGVRRDGEEFPLEISISHWEASQGPFFTAIVRDITERKNAEAALEKKAEELARSNQELEQFAYVASHDLQEPLRMVSNYTQLLARRYKDQLDADANEFIDFAVDGAKRMQALIHDLLEFARVGTRGKEPKPAPGEKVVGDAIANLTGAIEDAGAEVAVDPLPVLRCDAGQLTQVFQNLIGNAIKFRRPDTRPVIRVSATREGAFWRLSIRDNGIGIEPKYFERIFQMFQRLHGRGDYPGTGIGLALCKKIVERHGGRIQVASEAGQGTTFSFTIPDGETRKT
jgi:PAS domain S-box-containing protein